MIIFIDESGDPGFKTSKGSSPVFVIVLVIFKEPQHAETAAISLKNLRKELGYSDKTEFKFNKSRYEVKKRFCETVAAHNFCVRSIVVKKTAIYSNFLRTSKESFYNYLVMQVLRHSKNKLVDAKLKFDKRGEKKLRNELRSYLSHELDNKNSHVFSELKFVDSKQNILIQLADMLAGCIACYHKGKDTELYKIIKKRIESDWEFK